MSKTVKVGRKTVIQKWGLEKRVRSRCRIVLILVIRIKNWPQYHTKRLEQPSQCQSNRSGVGDTVLDRVEETCRGDASTAAVFRRPAPDECFRNSRHQTFRTSPQSLTFLSRLSGMRQMFSIEPDVCSVLISAPMSCHPPSSKAHVGRKSTLEHQTMDTPAEFIAL